MSVFGRLFKKTPKEEPAVFIGRLAPERPIMAIGDLHGRHDLLMRLMPKLEAFAQEGEVVFVGDLIDRGPHSAECLTQIRALCAQPAFLCLMGNHEKMMLDFLDQPAERGARWLRYGGLQTLMSFGLRGISERMSPPGLIDAAARLRSAMEPGLEDWIRTLPRQHQSGNIHLVHAAADPKAPMAAQEDRVLLWGHPAFETTPRQDGQFVLHGHVIVDDACCVNGRIAVDTGAYATGRLSYARITPEGALDFGQA